MAKQIIMYFHTSIYVVLRAIALLLVSVLLLSCASYKTPTVTALVMPGEEKLRFSGKGAGAGVMLSSSMGPMGIAIGVAIDEGIAKAIRENAQKNDLAIETYLQQSFDHVAQELNRNFAITVVSYGFKTTRAEKIEDPVIPYVSLRIKQEGVDGDVTIELPEKGVEACSLCVFELDQVKHSSEVLQAAFSNVSTRAAEQYILLYKSM